MENNKLRADRVGSHATVFRKNKKKILQTQDICGICGRPVDKTLKSPHPFSPCVDHIIPLNKGGHPSDINNLQLTHRTCNRYKSDKIFMDMDKYRDTVKENNSKIYQSRDWKRF